MMVVSTQTFAVVLLGIAIGTAVGPSLRHFVAGSAAEASAHQLPTLTPALWARDYVRGGEGDIASALALYSLEDHASSNEVQHDGSSDVAGASIVAAALVDAALLTVRGGADNCLSAVAIVDALMNPKALKAAQVSLSGILPARLLELRAQAMQCAVIDDDSIEQVVAAFEVAHAALPPAPAAQVYRAELLLFKMAALRSQANGIQAIVLLDRAIAILRDEIERDSATASSLRRRWLSPKLAIALTDKAEFTFNAAGSASAAERARDALVLTHEAEELLVTYADSPSVAALLEAIRETRSRYSQPAESN